MTIVAMCDKVCTLSSVCRRHQDSGTKPDNLWQVYFEPPQDGNECEYFIFKEVEDAIR